MNLPIPHTLGLDLVKQSQIFTNEALESFEELFTWLDEILETAKAAFQSSEIQTLPKTPSAKRRRGRKRKSEVPSFIRRSSISIAKHLELSLSNSPAYDVENIPPTDASILGTSHRYSTRSTRQRALQAFQISNTSPVESTAPKTRKRPQRGKAKIDSSLPVTSPPAPVRGPPEPQVPAKATKNSTEVPAESISARIEGITSKENHISLDTERATSQSPPQSDCKKPAREPSLTATTIEGSHAIPAAIENKQRTEDSGDNVIVLSSTAAAVKNTPKTSVDSLLPPGEEQLSSDDTSGNNHKVDNSSYVIEITEDPLPNLPVICTPWGQESVPVVVERLRPKETDTDSGVISDERQTKVSSSDSPSSVTSCQTGRASPPSAAAASSSAKESVEVAGPPRTRTRTKLQQQQVPAAAKDATCSSISSTDVEEPRRRMTRSKLRTKPAAVQEPVLAPDGPATDPATVTSTDDDLQKEDTGPRTRTRVRKRKSEEMEAKTDGESKRQCPDDETKEGDNCKTSVVTVETADDADVEDSDEEEETDMTRTETWTETCSVPTNLFTPMNNGCHSFLASMNSSYARDNRSFTQNNYSLSKFVRNGTLTGSAQRNGTQSRFLSGLGSNIKSFLKKTATPIKATNNQEFLEQRKREMEDKHRKEQERMIKRDELQKMKMEERKKKREERMRKVAEARQMKEVREQELKDKKNKKLVEKLSVTDRNREEKLKEEREKLRLRWKKQQEAGDRRNVEDEERNRKQKEQEEEQMRHTSMLQRKKEYEEQERLRRVAEEKRKIEEQKERMMEADREKKNEIERRHRIEDEKEQERLRLKAEREREVARQRAERERLIKEKQREQELAMKEKLKELEKERLLYEQNLLEKKQLKEQQLQKILNPSPAIIVTSASQLSTSQLSTSQKETATRMNTTMTLNTSSKPGQSSCESYPMTPQRGSYNNYDITNLRSDDSTDEEDGPRKPIPSWAQGSELKIALLKQYYNPPHLDEIFNPVESPDLNELFIKKKSRFNKRTSSAQWDSPMMKSHVPCYY